MRLIGTVDTQKEAFLFYSFLMKEGIRSTYEPFEDPEANKERVRIWIYDEDEIDQAITFLDQFKEDPKAPQFADLDLPEAPPKPPDLIAEQQKQEEQEHQEQIARPAHGHVRFRGAPPLKKKRPYPFTIGLIFICIVLYLVNGMQQVQIIRDDGKLGIQLGMTPIQQKLMFDYPESRKEINAFLQKYSIKSAKELEDLPADQFAQFKKASEIPTWQGVLPIFINWIKKSPDPEKESGPMFQEIKEGQVWRLFTPCLLHGGLLHIMFNMIWAWILLRPLEERLSFLQLILLIVIIAVAANVAQYLVSGPMFLGFSGVVCGLVGFIWVRQKKAPWEGYPLNRSTLIFVLVFVLSMFLIEIITLASNLIFDKQISVSIANTAHIVGGLTGALLALLPLFARRPK